MKMIKKMVRIPLVSLFENPALTLVEQGGKALDLMSDEERKIYNETPKVFDHLVKELMDNFSDKKVSKKLRMLLMEWFLLFVVRVYANIEANL